MIFDWEFYLQGRRISSFLILEGSNKIIGQDSAKDRLKSALQRKRFAFLIGNPGVGKSLTVRTLTKELDISRDVKGIEVTSENYFLKGKYIYDEDLEVSQTNNQNSVPVPGRSPILSLFIFGLINYLFLDSLLSGLFYNTFLSKIATPLVAATGFFLLLVPMASSLFFEVPNEKYFEQITAENITLLVLALFAQVLVGFFFTKVQPLSVISITVAAHITFFMYMTIKYNSRDSSSFYSDQSFEKKNVSSKKFFFEEDPVYFSKGSDMELFGTIGHSAYGFSKNSNETIPAVLEYTSIGLIHRAHKGFIVFDELAELSFVVQRALLSVIESKSENLISINRSAQQIECARLETELNIIGCANYDIEQYLLPQLYDRFLKEGYFITFNESMEVNQVNFDRFVSWIRTELNEISFRNNGPELNLSNECLKLLLDYAVSLSEDGNRFTLRLRKYVGLLNRIYVQMLELQRDLTSIEVSEILDEFQGISLKEKPLEKPLENPSSTVDGFLCYSESPNMKTFKPTLVYIGTTPTLFANYRGFTAQFFDTFLPAGGHEYSVFNFFQKGTNMHINNEVSDQPLWTPASTFCLAFSKAFNFPILEDVVVLGAILPDGQYVQAKDIQAFVDTQLLSEKRIIIPDLDFYKPLGDKYNLVVSSSLKEVFWNIVNRDEISKSRVDDTITRFFGKEHI